MITPTYKLCSACLGTKTMEHIPHSDFNTTKPSEERRSDPCQVCRGKGYLPTGDFILDGPDKDDILVQISKLEDQFAAMTIRNKVG